jgi:hypothetical protein
MICVYRENMDMNVCMHIVQRTVVITRVEESREAQNGSLSESTYIH